MATWPTLGLWIDLQATKDAFGSQPADPRTSGGFTNVGAYVESVTVTRGMSRYDGAVIRYQPGSFSAVLRNDDQRFDPLDPSPTYPAGAIEPLRGLALQASWAGSHYKLFRGATDAWMPRYGLNGNTSTVVLAGIDQLGQAARFVFDNPSGIGGTGAGVLTGTWVNEALVEAPGVYWTQAWSPVNQGEATSGHQGWTGNVLGEAMKAVETELGELYVQGDAGVMFRKRHAIITEARSNTSQATFQPGTTLPFLDVAVSYDANGVRNTITGQRSGGAAQKVTDTTSRSKYGLRDFGNTSLVIQTDPEAADWAGIVLALSKNADPRLEQLVIDPQAAPATLFPQVLTRELGDRITVAFTPPGGSAVSRQAIIRGITHAINLDTWRTTYQLEDATKWDTADTGFFRFDSATFGKFDTGRLG